MRNILSFILLISLTVVSQLNAKDILLGIGARAGATLDPDQVHLGIHADLGELAERVRVQPNVEIGFGNDMTIVAVNPEVIYIFQKKERWTPYAGGGLGLNFLFRDKTLVGQDDTELEVGLNLLCGVETKVAANTNLFFEGKFGIGDSPDFKVSCGFTILR